MTYKEAIKVLKWALNRLDGWKYIIDSRGTINPLAKVEAFSMAIVALEKQIPKKPYVESAIDDWCFACPACGNQDIHYLEHHCTCGQSLSWEDYE